MDWENQIHQTQEFEGNSSNNNNHNPNPTAGNNNNNGNAMFVKVMTDEQMEVLRKQIAVYATICQQLVDLHKSLTSQHDLAGVRLGNLYCDPLMTSAGHKITGRQRWTPTPVQLQILERMFEQGNGTPSKQKIKDITSELLQHGQISETNVYNWFQNRRARSKRKQQVSAPNNAESEVETEVESPNHNKTKSEDFQSHHESAPRSDELCFQNPEISSSMHSMDPRSHKVEPILPSDTISKPAGSMSQMSFYGSMLSNPKLFLLLHLFLQILCLSLSRAWLNELELVHEQLCSFTSSVFFLSLFGYLTKQNFRMELNLTASLYFVILYIFPGCKYDVPKFMRVLPGMDHLIGKIENPGSYASYLHPDDYNMNG